MLQSPIESTPTNNMTYNIVHHYVTNPNKHNKFRIVFDASAKFAGTSLNDYLLKVLDLLNSSVTAGKVSKYGVFSGRHFLVFSPNTGNYGPEKNPYLDTFHAVSNNIIKIQ